MRGFKGSSRRPGFAHGFVRDTQIVGDFRIAGVPGINRLKIFFGLVKPQQSRTKTARRLLSPKLSGYFASACW